MVRDILKTPMNPMNIVLKDILSHPGDLLIWMGPMIRSSQVTCCLKARDLSRAAEPAWPERCVDEQMIHHVGVERVGDAWSGVSRF